MNMNSRHSNGRIGARIISGSLLALLLSHGFSHSAAHDATDQRAQRSLLEVVEGVSVSPSPAPLGAAAAGCVPQLGTGSGRRWCYKEEARAAKEPHVTPILYVVEAVVTLKKSSDCLVWEPQPAPVTVYFCDTLWPSLTRQAIKMDCAIAAKQRIESVYPQLKGLSPSYVIADIACDQLAGASVIPADRSIVAMAEGGDLDVTLTSEAPPAAAGGRGGAANRPKYKADKASCETCLKDTCGEPLFTACLSDPLCVDYLTCGETTPANWAVSDFTPGGCIPVMGGQNDPHVADMLNCVSMGGLCETACDDVAGPPPPPPPMEPEECKASPPSDVALEDSSGALITIDYHSYSDGGAP